MSRCRIRRRGTRRYRLRDESMLRRASAAGGGNGAETAFGRAAVRARRRAHGAHAARAHASSPRRVLACVIRILFCLIDRHSTPLNRPEKQ
ncbi:hypothetical protein Bmul_4421 [Burkholderia multivorans ATCC 17616]|nr:hypothetical protein Bmul_4421 [Burkholderia multivorans ATCC 17616]